MPPTSTVIGNPAEDSSLHVKGVVVTAVAGAFHDMDALVCEIFVQVIFVGGGKAVLAVTFVVELLLLPLDDTAIIFTVYDVPVVRPVIVALHIVPIVVTGARTSVSDLPPVRVYIYEAAPPVAGVQARVMVVSVTEDTVISPGVFGAVVTVTEVDVGPVKAIGLSAPCIAANSVARNVYSVSAVKPVIIVSFVHVLVKLAVSFRVSVLVDEG